MTCTICCTRLAHKLCTRHVITHFQALYRIAYQNPEFDFPNFNFLNEINFLNNQFPDYSISRKLISLHLHVCYFRSHYIYMQGHAQDFVGPNSVIFLGAPYCHNPSSLPPLSHQTYSLGPYFLRFIKYFYPQWASDYVGAQLMYN